MATSKNWVDRLSESVRKELQEVREFWRAGAYRPLTASEIYKHCLAKVGIDVTVDTFRRWLNGR